MPGFRLFASFASFARDANGLRPGARNALIAIGICLAGLGLIIGLGTIIGSPSDPALADALAVGG